MARFLISYARNSNPDTGLPYSLTAFKVSDSCSADEVTVPLNTIFFMFANANVETEKELIESFVTLKLGEAMITSSNITMTIENEGKRYWIGKVITIDDELQAIHNKHIKAIIPFTCLNGNDEVIDL